VNEVIVLAAALADQTGETGVIAEIVPHSFPQPLEGSKI